MALLLMSIITIYTLIETPSIIFRRICKALHQLNSNQYLTNLQQNESQSSPISLVKFPLEKSRYLSILRSRSTSRYKSNYRSRFSSRYKIGSPRCIIPKIRHQNTSNSTLQHIGNLTAQLSTFIAGEPWHERRCNPKYLNLEQELLHNKIGTLTDELYNETVQMASAKFEQDAISVTSRNKLTLDHYIALKVYTDFDILQRIFKQNYGSPELYHFFNLLHEVTSFASEKLRDNNKFLFCGLTTKLLFNSVTPMIGQPLSTSIKEEQAVIFAGRGRPGAGIVIRFKKLNKKSQYLNVEELSALRYERERLIMGCGLQICGIFVDSKWIEADFFIACRFLEAIISGRKLRKIEGKMFLHKLIQQTLYELMIRLFDVDDENVEGVEITDYMLALVYHVLKHNIDLYGPGWKLDSGHVADDKLTNLLKRHLSSTMQ